MLGFHALQPDVRLWDALANHLRAAAYISPNAFDGKMAEAKAKDERLIAEGKITRPPCHFGYPNTPNMAMVQREKEEIDKAIARRRTMKNIQEQKEREEAKRKRQEQQKRQEGEK